MWASSHTPLTICYKSSLGELFKFIFLAALAFRSVDLTWFSIRPLATEASGSDCPSVEKLRQSREAFQKALALNPANADAHNALGLVLMELNEYGNPDSPELHSNYGLALWQKSSAERSHNLDRVIAEFLKALQYLPHDAGINNNLGMALKENGETAGAIDHFHKAL